MAYNPQPRLFKVMEGEKPVYFNNKRSAKRLRDKLIEAGKAAVVMRGPDHYRGESFNKSRQMPGKRSLYL